MAQAVEFAPLPRAFYARPVLQVARDCIGKVLVHQSPHGTVAGRIVEAEAYRGPEDRAAHSAGGRRTSRTEVMFGPPGHAYLFFVYGMHWQFNLVTTAEGAPHAVLIRALEPVVGRELMAERRGLPASSVKLTNGPGKLCQALGLCREHYGLDLCEGRLFLSTDFDNARGARVKVGRSARIGIEYAGPDWAAKPWRFFELGNRYVSGSKRALVR